MKKYSFFACIICAAIVFASCNTNEASNEVTIYGNVIDAQTGLPLYNVLIQEKNKVGGSTVTGNDGNYEFTLPLDGSSSGRFYLIASKDKYASSEYELEMDKVDKNRRVKVDFQLTKESITYSGKVLDSKNRPIVDAHISAKMNEPEGYSSTWYHYGTTAITDINGEYSLDLPRPHKYNDAKQQFVNQWKFELTASKDGYVDLVYTLNQNAEDMGKNIPVNFVLKTEDENAKEKQVTISGKVTSGSSYLSALSNAYLTVYRYRNNDNSFYVGSVMTDSNGKYTISVIPEYSNTTHWRN